MRRENLDHFVGEWHPALAACRIVRSHHELFVQDELTKDIRPGRAMGEAGLTKTRMVG